MLTDRYKISCFPTRRDHVQIFARNGYDSSSMSHSNTDMITTTAFFHQSFHVIYSSTIKTQPRRPLSFIPMIKQIYKRHRLHHEHIYHVIQGLLNQISFLATFNAILLFSDVNLANARLKYIIYLRSTLHHLH